MKIFKYQHSLLQPMEIMNNNYSLQYTILIFVHTYIYTQMYIYIKHTHTYTYTYVLMQLRFHGEKKR